VADAIRQQLRYSDKTVKEIAAALDFPSLSFFGRFVREHLGMSPTAFRRQSLQSQDSFGVLH
jgi:AraC-like DNA-binding protein